MAKRQTLKSVTARQVVLRYCHSCLCDAEMALDRLRCAWFDDDLREIAKEARKAEKAIQEIIKAVTISAVRRK